MEYGTLTRGVEVKASAGNWTVEGYVSTYSLDAGGDIVVPGAFAASLASGQKVRLLLGHDQTKILGSALSLREDSNGLFGKFSISKTALGTDTHVLLKDGALDSFSIGYIARQVDYDREGHRLLQDLDLLEASLVAVPMQSEALVTGVKRRGAGREMAEMQRLKRSVLEKRLRRKGIIV